MSNSSSAFAQGDRRALSRLLTLAARGEDDPRRSRGELAAAQPGRRGSHAGHRRHRQRRRGQEHADRQAHRGDPAGGAVGRGAGVRPAEPAHRRGFARRSHPHAEPAGRRCGVHPQPGHAQRSFGCRAQRRSHDRSVRPLRIRHRHCRDRRGRARRHGRPRGRRCRHRPRAAGDRRRAAMGKGRPARNRRHRRGPQGRSAERRATSSRSFASCSTCPAAGRSRCYRSARTRGSEWKNYGPRCKHAPAGGER